MPPEDLQYESRIELVDEPLTPDAATALDAPDRRDGRVYEYTPQLAFALEVALVTGRPLLLRGDPGTGKSSFAAFAARNLDRRYYEHVVTSATRAEDLLWRYDAVRRLSDAQVEGRELHNSDYVEPGVLWWAFDRDSARRRGEQPTRAVPEAVEPDAELNAERGEDAVVLIDEIDKADPDVPNGLLGPLGSTSFVVRETGARIQRTPRSEREAAAHPLSRLLVVITTNQERDLPQAFVRRCVVHELEHPETDQLVQIARSHHIERPGLTFDAELAKALAEELETMRAEATERGVRAPSVAEYLDALRACSQLRVGVGTPEWKLLASLTLLKETS